MRSLLSLGSGFSRECFNCFMAPARILTTLVSSPLDLASVTADTSSPGRTGERCGTKAIWKPTSDKNCGPMLTYKHEQSSGKLSLKNKNSICVHFAIVETGFFEGGGAYLQ